MSKIMRVRVAIGSSRGQRQDSFGRLQRTQISLGMFDSYSCTKSRRERRHRRLAGVSKSTLSRAPNDSPPVEAGTKARILAIAKELEFRPNSAALRGEGLACALIEPGGRNAA
jgi:hypothetical protein